MTNILYNGGKNTAGNIKSDIYNNDEEFKKFIAKLYYLVVQYQKIISNIFDENFGKEL
jgi:hypothetical protein